MKDEQPSVTAALIAKAEEEIRKDERSRVRQKSIEELSAASYRPLGQTWSVRWPDVLSALERICPWGTTK